jgi:protein-tyrosine phosphatase
MRLYNKIVFVGESGTSRSAMALAIMKEYRLKQPVEIMCRALVALFSEPINQKAEAVLISNGITVGEYISVQLSEEDFADDTLMIVMEEVQREKIVESYENANPMNIQVLTEMVGDELEIINPYGGSLQLYGLCYETLNKSIKKLVEKLNEGE